MFRPGRGPGRAERSPPGSDPGRVSAAGLMALASQPPGLSREAPALSERPGSVSTPKRGQGHEIREIRPYVEGDDARHLDAAATARTGSPQLRSFHEDRERSLMLIADFRRPMLWGTRGALRSVVAARGLALAGWAALREGGSVGVIALTETGPDHQPPRPRERGMALVSACLERAHDKALAEAEGAGAERGGAGRPEEGGVMVSARPLGDELRLILPRIPRGAAIVFASGFDLPGEGFEAALVSLAARGILRLAMVEDAFEQAPGTASLPLREGKRRFYAGFRALPGARAERAGRLRQLIAASGGTVQLLTAGAAGFVEAPASLPEPRPGPGPAAAAFASPPGLQSGGQG